MWITRLIYIIVIPTFKWIRFLNSGHNMHFLSPWSCLDQSPCDMWRFCENGEVLVEMDLVEVAKKCHMAYGEWSKLWTKQGIGLAFFLYNPWGLLLSAKFF